MGLKQLKQMGESVLSAAQALANSKGVLALRSPQQGNVEDEIATECGELDAEYLVLGRPRRPRGTRCLPISAQFAERIRNKVGTEIIWSESLDRKTNAHVRSKVKEGQPCSSP